MPISTFFSARNAPRFGAGRGRAELFRTLPIDGIRCDRAEGSLEHIHANLQIFDRGKAVTIPASVGIPQSADCLIGSTRIAPMGLSTSNRR